MKRKIFSLSFLAILLLMSSQIFATSILPLNLAQLVKRSHRIIEGSVTDIRNGEENGRIVTYVTLDVKNWIKGEPSADNSLVFSQVATTGGLPKSSLNLAKYQLGKSYVLFLPAQKEGSLMPVAGQQGVFEIHKDQIAGLKQRKRMLRQNLHLNDPATEATVVQNLSDDSTDFSVATFTETLRLIVTEQNESH